MQCASACASSVQVRVRAAAASGVNAKAGVHENRRQKAIAVDAVLTCGRGGGRACARGAWARAWPAYLWRTSLARGGRWIVRRCVGFVHPPHGGVCVAYVGRGETAFIQADFFFLRSCGSSPYRGSSLHVCLFRAIVAAVLLSA